MSTSKRRSKVRLIGVLVTIAGALVVVAAGVTVGMVSGQLRTERVTVTAVTPRGPVLSAPSGRAADLFNTDGLTVMNQGGSGSVMALSDTGDSMKNGSFLHALLSIAAVALCVALPVMGIGVLFAVVGFGPLTGSPKGRHGVARSPGRSPAR